ncbi:MAG: 4Fe-4S binding protein [Mediterranea sp.]|jgi:adenylylsulfate reductase subunit B|nr:4Fe-4S binding protein [Mediterranea sp.]
MFHRRREVTSLSIDKDKCIGCEACVSACRRRVLDMSYRVDCYAWVKYPLDCVGCGRCVRACDTGAVELVTNLKR